jgi:MSHA biogenesis protein MshJ
MALAIKAYAQRIFDWIDALELRERILLLLATIVILYLAADSMGFQPTLKAQQVTEQNTSALEMKLSALHEQANLLNYRSTDESTRLLQESRDTLAAELTDLDANILGQLGALVEPAQAANVLEQVLSKHRGLKMKSLQAHTLPLDEITSAHEQLAALSRYQLEFELEGGYLDLLTYLQELESMPWKFFWQNVNFQVADYPHAVTRLQLYTLGGAPNG